jgi:hypothetical protein
MRGFVLAAVTLSALALGQAPWPIPATWAPTSEARHAGLDAAAPGVDATPPAGLDAAAPGVDATPPAGLDAGAWEGPNNLTSPDDFTNVAWAGAPERVVVHASAGCPLAPDNSARMDLITMSGTNHGMWQNAAGSTHSLWIAEPLSGSPLDVTVASYNGSVPTRTMCTTTATPAVCSGTGETGIWFFISGANVSFCAWRARAY